MVTDDDRNDLRGFVSAVWHWLRACYVGGAGIDLPWPMIRVDKELGDYAVPAWREFEKEYPLGRLLESIDKAPDDVLTSHGLYGAQLQYKLQLVARGAQHARSGHRGWTRRFIELIDIIIDSLDPTGLAGGLKELKDALVGSLPEDE